MGHDRGRRREATCNSRRQSQRSFSRSVGIPRLVSRGISIYGALFVDELAQEGYRVVRFTGQEVVRWAEACAQKVAQLVE